MFELKLANSRTIATNKASELAAFFESGGRSIDGHKARGGKSKGARNRGRKTVQRTRDAK
jgi:hypothetical protein